MDGIELSDGSKLVLPLDVLTTLFRGQACILENQKARLRQRMWRAETMGDEDSLSECIQGLVYLGRSLCETGPHVGNIFSEP